MSVMNIRTKLILSVGILTGMIILLVALSVVNLQILTATEPDSPAAVPSLQRALLWISVTGGVCILASIVLLVWLPRSISKPIRELITPGEKTEPQTLGDVILLKNITEFKELDSARTTFISTISHELKTPISAILMSLQLLDDHRVGALNGEQEQLSKSIRDNADRLLSITGELLNLTQVEAGKLQMMPKITKPIELIEYAIKANQVQADRFGIQIEVEYPDEKVPKLFVDSEKIAWVLTNLLSNAIRYSKENGRVIIGARLSGSFVEMYVQDFGRGIDPRYHQSIFDRYFRVPGTKVQGSGLGLSISKDFVEAHGGTLTVESELGRGSRFVIRLKG